MTSATDVLEAVARGICAEREAVPWEDIPDGRIEQRLCRDKKGNFRDVNQNSKDDYRNEARAAISALEPVIAEAYLAGSQDGHVFLRGTHDVEYAARIISSLRAGGEP